MNQASLVESIVFKHYLCQPPPSMIDVCSRCKKDYVLGGLLSCLAQLRLLGFPGSPFWSMVQYPRPETSLESAWFLMVSWDVDEDPSSLLIAAELLLLDVVQRHAYNCLLELLGLTSEESQQCHLMHLSLNTNSQTRLSKCHIHIALKKNVPLDGYLNSFVKVLAIWFQGRREKNPR